jgi:hypothetical protein
MKLELLCDELNKKTVLKRGIYLKTDVTPHTLEAKGYTWYIMSEGGAYVYDAWHTSRTFNPNRVLFVRHQEGYGVVEGGYGRPTVLDHPLHIALFEDNFRHYCLPYERFMAMGKRLLPPQLYTPQYPRKLDTVLVHSHGPIDLFLHRAFRGGLHRHLLRRVDVEQTPPPTPSPHYYSEDENTPTDRITTSSLYNSNLNSIERAMVHSKAPSQHTSESMQNAGLSTPEQPLSYSENYPPHPYNYATNQDDARTTTFNPMNSAEQTTSSTV